MSEKKYLIVIAGPTASGKTSMGISLAKRLNASILSADSRQFYQEMSIGTAKPTPSEMEGIPHYFINNNSIHSDYSVGDYEREALNLLENLFKKDQFALLLGGSGLFIRAVCEGLDHFPEVPKDIQAAVESEYEEKGLEFLQENLKEQDPVYAKEVDLNNPHRLIRALSVIRTSGQTFSSYRVNKKRSRPFTPIYIQLYHPREKLYERINKRVDLMVEAGLEKEAKALHPLQHLNALQSVGYQEWFDHFNGKITREEAINLIKQNTRRYAKRQMTWFRKRAHWIHIFPTELDSAFTFINFIIKNNLEVKSSALKNPAKPYEQKYEITVNGKEHCWALATVVLQKNKSPLIEKKVFKTEHNSPLTQLLENEISYYLTAT